MLHQVYICIEFDVEHMEGEIYDGLFGHAIIHI
jgi:hypothetical protein